MNKERVSYLTIIGVLLIVIGVLVGKIIQLAIFLSMQMVFPNDEYIIIAFLIITGLMVVLSGSLLYCIYETL